jgi:hypothetical protein
MGGFFLVFSSFKLLNLKGFVESYVAYDILAKRYRVYARLYPFIELALGIGYLSNVASRTVNSLTFVLMAFSSLGVYQALREKKKLQCACLGTFFKLPMTYVTLFEDGLMAAMALTALVLS